MSGEPWFHVGVFRHGRSTYRQLEVAPADAHDLTEDGVETVLGSGRAFLAGRRPRRAVIHTSPMGRTLHTARLLARVLAEHDVAVEGPRIEPELTEVHGFSWALFDPLVLGGEARHEGRSCPVDVRVTNPGGLGHQEYFFFDHAHRLPAGALPGWYAAALARFERASAARARLLAFLRRATAHDEGREVLLVTHEGLIQGLMDRYSGGACRGLPPGQCVHLVRGPGGLFVRRAGEDVPGDPALDLLGDAR